MIVPHRRCLLQQRMHKVIVAMCLDSSLASLQVPVCKATHFVCFCSSWLDVLPQFLSTLLHVNPSKASGPDNIPNIILKTFAESIVPSKTTIFRQSLETGLFPMDWQTTNIASVFKKKDGNKAKNYRPVSLTSVTCNLLEHIIYRHLLTHFEKHHILTSRKYGFRPGYSSETQ